MNDNELLKRAVALKPLLQVGKKGLSDEFFSELSLLLRKKGLLKIKFLKSFLDVNDKDDSVRLISERTGARVLKVIGNTVILYKKD